MNFSLKHGLLGGGIMLLLFLVLSLSNSLFEQVPAGNIAVIQSLISGELTVHFKQGLKWQGFGTVTLYDREEEYRFYSETAMGNTSAERIENNRGPIRIRFNDGGKANMSGSFRFELPTVAPDKFTLEEATRLMIEIHKKYGSQGAVRSELIQTIIEKSVYMTGPLMSSKQSSAEKRNDLLSFIEDQAKEGVYKTRVIERKEIDPLSGKEKTVAITEIILGEDNRPQRQADSDLKKFGINLYNLALNEIKYDETIEKQIAQQQTAIMRVQTSIAEAREAEQQAIKAEAQGKADAATARAKMEVEKVQEVTQAEKKRDVAKLAMEAAEYYKTEQRLIGEGDAARKKAVMLADGALDKKLEAWIKGQEAWAKAFAESKHPYVPSTVIGGNGKGVNSAQSWMQMMMLQAANDLNLKMKVK